MKHMTRDELGELFETLEDWQYIDIITAEFDRLTAINAQLLEACTAYIENPQSPMVYDMIEAAIRAVESEEK